MLFSIAVFCAWMLNWKKKERKTSSYDCVLNEDDLKSKRAAGERNRFPSGHFVQENRRWRSMHVALGIDFQGYRELVYVCVCVV